MIRAWEKTLKRMTELGRQEGSGWEFVPSNHARTILHGVTLPTPDYAKAKWGRSLPLWTDETYDVLTFVTLVAGKMIIGTAPAPWVGRRDWDAPFWLADAILEDPGLAHDADRIFAMRKARKGPGRGIRR